MPILFNGLPAIRPFRTISTNKSLIGLSAEKKNKKWKINYPVSTLWPASYTKDFKETGLQPTVRKSSEENKKELLELLLNAAKKDTANARLHTAIADINLLLVRDVVDILLAKGAMVPHKEKFDSAIASHYNNAVTSYKKNVAADKEFETVVYCKMGDFYSLAGKTEEAKNCYRKAIVADAGFLYPLVKLGNFYLNSKGSKAGDSALLYYHKAITIDPDFEPFNFTIANAYWNKGELDKAAAYYHEAVRLDPGSAPATAHLANFYTETGKADSARFYFSKTVDAFIKTPDFFLSELFFVVTTLADSLNFPKECGAFFKAGLEVPAWNKADISTRNACDIEYYWQYARYSCSINDTTSALKYLGQVFSTLRSQNDKFTARPKYDKIPTDKYLAVIRSLPAFTELMEKYPFSEIGKKEYLNIR